jgi:hypothetical protein
MKWFLIIVLGGAAIYYAVTGDSGGAKNAASNYQKVLLKDKYSK